MPPASTQALRKLPRTGSMVVYDLEYTAWEGSLQTKWSRPGEYREVVQIGAVWLAVVEDFREVAAFDILVKPKRNPVLSDYFIQLTGIDNARLARDGVAFEEALGRFVAFCGSADTVVSNGGDEVVIAENCRLHDLPYVAALPFFNVRPLLVETLGTAKGSLFSHALPARVGAEFDGNAHDGLGDARAIAAALRKLRADGLL